MKKLALLFLALPLLAVAPAKADIRGEGTVPLAYTCRLSGQMKGLNVAIGLGAEVIKGKGTLSCHNTLNGHNIDMPVRLSLIGAGAGLEVSVIRSLYIRTAGIRVNDPHEFLRSYGLGATTGATLVAAGLEFDTAVRVNANTRGAGFEVALQGRDALGLGAHLYGMTFKIAAR